MKIEKINDNMYQISQNNQKIKFSRNKFEDLYYAVPVSTTALIRLLQDNICSNTQERICLNEMLQNCSDRLAELADLQKQIQNMKL